MLLKTQIFIKNVTLYYLIYRINSFAKYCVNVIRLGIRNVKKKQYSKYQGIEVFFEY